ncbi:MAG: Beta-Ala-Xaa dipeptidase [Firmicutes bacterium ADurb.Bin182]|nr:MAG: Beta-Ala-Xaa dipeptidase [Firmicutes bacterium ADurb.Bin182]
MSELVASIIEKRKDEIIRSLQENLKFKSVKEPSETGMPFGKPIDDALRHALSLADSMGFRTKNLDGYIGIAEWGKGEETLAIMCHLDVVPEGTGWDFPPYGGAIDNGRIYGRGTLDDKGPAISALYALYAVKEAGVKTKRKIRVLLGCDEESGMECLKHYLKVEPMPEIAFSPDAEYPAVNSEKTIIHASFGRKFASKLSIDSGTRPNVVPGTAECTLPLDLSLVKEKAAEFSKESGFQVAVKESDQGVNLAVTGKDAHASTPELGKNALQALFQLLKKLPLEGTDKEVAAGLADCLKMDMHGESFGLDVQDESGRLTLNPGVIHWDENGVRLDLDIRCPISYEGEKVLEKLQNVFSAFGLQKLSGSISQGHYIPKDSELVSKLLDIYEKHTGKRLEPLAIGGGTYARKFKNAVAFGPELPGVEAPVHMPNEFISIEHLMFNTYIIADAILALACEE